MSFYRTLCLILCAVSFVVLTMLTFGLSVPTLPTETPEIDLLTPTSRPIPPPTTHYIRPYPQANNARKPSTPSRPSPTLQCHKDILYLSSTKRFHFMKPGLGPWTFPEKGSPLLARYFHKQVTIHPFPAEGAVVGPRDSSRVTLTGSGASAYMMVPMPGACFKNAWHTVADYMVTLHDTIRQHPMPTLFTWTCADVWDRRDINCYSEKSCTQQTLFWFVRALTKDVYWMGEHLPNHDIHIPELCVGVDPTCSPVHEGVNTTDCEENLWRFRGAILAKASILPRKVTEAELACPNVVYLTRSNAKYRRWHNEGEVLERLKQHLPRCATITPILFHQKWSVPQQLSVVHNATIIITGRGAASSYAGFLPHGGGFLSVSGDLWNPYRDLEPSWYVTQHRTVDITHPDSPKRPPIRFSYGYDSNKSGLYEADVDKFLEAFDTLLRRMRKIVR